VCVATFEPPGNRGSARFQSASQEAVEPAGIFHFMAAGSTFRSWRARALIVIKDAAPATILP
jgi:hypothetical protein